MEEAADLFGVSVKTFIKLLKEEKVPARKIGREWRFSRRALIDWLALGDSQTYSDSESETKDFFNDVAPNWEELRKNFYDESIKNQLAELNLLKKTSAVIDLGAGDGYISRFAAPFVKNVIAVDISYEMLRELEQKAKAQGLKNIEILNTDGRDVPLADSSVDVVCAAMYLHHIQEPEAAVREMHRLLKPGGTVFLADFCLHDDEKLLTVMHDFWPGFDPDQMGKVFQNAGFSNISYQILPHAPKRRNPHPGHTKKVFIIIGVK